MRAGTGLTCRRVGLVGGPLVGASVFASAAAAASGMAPLPARVALRELLLEPAAVEQHDLDELRGCAGQVDRSIEAVAHDDRQQAAVIEVGVGDEDRVEVLRLEAERDAVPDHLVGAALEHPAVDEDPGARGRQQEARSRDGRRAAEEGELHVRRRRGGGVANARWILRGVSGV